jgi:hypothetical protein
MSPIANCLAKLVKQARSANSKRTPLSARRAGQACRRDAPDELGSLCTIIHPGPRFLWHCRHRREQKRAPAEADALWCWINAAKTDRLWRRQIVLLAAQAFRPTMRLPA